MEREDNMEHKLIRGIYRVKYKKYLLLTILFVFLNTTSLIVYFSVLINRYFIVDVIVPLLCLVLWFIHSFFYVGCCGMKNILSLIPDNEFLVFQKDGIIIINQLNITKTIHWGNIDNIFIKEYKYYFNKINGAYSNVLFLVSDGQKFKNYYYKKRGFLKKVNDESGCLLSIEWRPEIQYEIKEYWEGEIEKI